MSLLSYSSWIDTASAIHRNLLQYQYEKHLTRYTQPNADRKFKKQNNFGWTSLAFDIPGMSMKPKTARSYPSFLRKIEKEGYQYYRPNLSYTSASHMKRKLRWMVGLFFDFDAHNLANLGISGHEQLLAHIEKLGFSVYGIVKTNTGYHAYLPMRPLRGCWNGEQTIKRYDAVLKRLAKILGSDPAAASAEHYFRTPQSTNIVYFNPVNKPDFTWYEKQLIEPIKENSGSDRSRVSFGKLMSQKAMLKMLSGDFDQYAVVKVKDQVVRKIGRNNAAFTLALGMKADGWSQEQAIQELHRWYHHRINTHNFALSEIDRAVERAYAGSYKGPHPFFVHAFTGIKLHPITQKIAPADRKRVTYSEIQDKFVLYLQRHYKEMNKDLVMSQAKLAEALKVSVRSLQAVIKQMKESNLLTIDTIRIGRSSVSIYFLDATLLKETHDDAELSVSSPQQVRTTESNQAESQGTIVQARPQRKLRTYPYIHDAISFTYFLASGVGKVVEFRGFKDMIAWVRRYEVYQDKGFFERSPFFRGSLSIVSLSPYEKFRIGKK